MPRKKHLLKNKYCKNSNLTELQFEMILHTYIWGHSATEAQRIIELVSHKISRPTIETYFLKIGERLFKECSPLVMQMLIDSQPGHHWSYKDYKELEDYYVGEYWKLINENLDYRSYREGGVILPSPVIHELLLSRKKLFRGFPIKTFKAHLGYALYLLLMIDPDTDLSECDQSASRESQIYEAGIKRVMIRLEEEPL